LDRSAELTDAVSRVDGVASDFFLVSLVVGSAGPGVPRILARLFQWSDIISGCSAIGFSDRGVSRSTQKEPSL